MKIQIISTTRTTAVTLCYSVAEYAAPLWARSHHAHVMGSELNTARSVITGCLKPTNVEDLYLLAGIAPPDIRRDVCARVEKKKQESYVAHSLYGQTPTESRLKSRSCFLSSVSPSDFHPKVIHCNEWHYMLKTKTHLQCQLQRELSKRSHQPMDNMEMSQQITYRCYVHQGTAEEVGLAPNDTAYKRWSCHSGHKLLCKWCRTSPPPEWGPDFPFLGHAGHADPLDGWRCCSQKRVMSRPIQVRQL